RWEVLLSACAFSPLLLMCVNGQDSGLLFLLFAFAFHCWAQEKKFSAGVVLALSLFKFQYAIPMVAILGWKHSRLLAGFLVSAGVLVAISFWLVGISGTHGFVALSQSDHYEVPAMMANLRGFIESVSGNRALWLIALVSVLLFFVAGWLISRARVLLAPFGVAVLTAWLLAFHGHFYDAVLLIIPILIAMNRVRWPVLLVLASVFLAIEPLR